MTCEYCGKEYEAGNRPEGFPNGMTFIGKDGHKMTICADCLIRIGRSEDGTLRYAFFKQVTGR